MEMVAGNYRSGDASKKNSLRSNLKLISNVC